MKINSKFYTKDKSYWYKVLKIEDNKVFCSTSTGYFIWVSKEELEKLNEK